MSTVRSFSLILVKFNFKNTHRSPTENCGVVKHTFYIVANYARNCWRSVEKRLGFLCGVFGQRGKTIHGRECCVKIALCFSKTRGCVKSEPSERERETNLKKKKKQPFSQRNHEKIREISIIYSKPCFR